MKFFIKKIMVLTLSCVMIFQMMNTVFAATKNWTDGNTLYEAVLTKDNSTTGYKLKFSGVAGEYHIRGEETDIELNQYNYVDASRPTFSLANEQLQDCMDAEGFLPSQKFYYPYSSGVVTVEADAVSGRYYAGYSSDCSNGTWRVLSGSDENGLMHVGSGQYDWKPTSVDTSRILTFRLS